MKWPWFWKSNFNFEVIRIFVTKKISSWIVVFKLLCVKIRSIIFIMYQISCKNPWLQMQVFGGCGIYDLLIFNVHLHAFRFTVVISWSTVTFIFKLNQAIEKNSRKFRSYTFFTDHAAHFVPAYTLQVLFNLS